MLDAINVSVNEVLATRVGQVDHHVLLAGHCGCREHSDQTIGVYIEERMTYWHSDLFGIL